MQSLCSARGLAVIPYFPLAAGFLSGKYRTQEDAAKSARAMFVGKYLDDRGLRVLAALDAASAALGAEHAAIALAWLLAKPSITAPIVSATSVAQLESTVKAASLRLPPDIVAALDRASQT
jgi:aryl-alcohol dehydrogenase-like predicted oxidoreductase